MTHSLQTDIKQDIGIYKDSDQYSYKYDLYIVQYSRYMESLCILFGVANRPMLMLVECGKVGGV